MLFNSFSVYVLCACIYQQNELINGCVFANRIYTLGIPVEFDPAYRNITTQQIDYFQRYNCWYTRITKASYFPLSGRLSVAHQPLNRTETSFHCLKQAFYDIVSQPEMRPQFRIHNNQLYFTSLFNAPGGYDPSFHSMGMDWVHADDCYYAHSCNRGEMTNNYATGFISILNRNSEHHHLDRIKWDFAPRSKDYCDWFVLYGCRLYQFERTINPPDGYGPMVRYENVPAKPSRIYRTPCEEPFRIHVAGDDVFLITYSGLLYRAQHYMDQWHMVEVLSKRPRIRVLIFDEDTQTAYAFGKGYGIALTGKAEPFACPDFLTPGLHHNPLPVLQRAWQQVQERRRTLLLATLRWW
jgi:hypothetical protein